MKIYLIGLPGSGKTTVGKVLAKKLNYEYIDLDAEIENRNSMLIESFIDDEGIDRFRALETNTLRSIKGNDIVVSCGGGIVEKEDNKLLMPGVIVFLDTSLELIKKRLKNDYPRPLLKRKSLEQLHNERNEKYKRFSNIIVSNDENIEHTVDKIIMKLGLIDE